MCSTPIQPRSTGRFSTSVQTTRTSGFDDVAEHVAARVPRCELVFGPPSDDARDYRADFSKIQEILPEFACAWSVPKGIDELLSVFERVHLDEQVKTNRGHVRLAQIRHLLNTGQVDDSLRWTE